MEFALLTPIELEFIVYALREYKRHHDELAETGDSGGYLREEGQLPIDLHEELITALTIVEQVFKSHQYKNLDIDDNNDNSGDDGD